jgi:hypothetical protein
MGSTGGGGGSGSGCQGIQWFRHGLPVVLGCVKVENIHVRVTIMEDMHMGVHSVR